MTNWLLLAQSTTGGGTAPAGGQQQTGPGMLIFPAMMVALIVFMILSSRSQKKREKKDRDNLMDSLSKNSKVLTIGGIVGTVISVRDNEVVVKVDESTNTKMTFTKAAIQRIITDDAPLLAEAK